MTPEQEKAVVEQYTAGVANETIWTTLSISRSTFYGILRRHKVPTHLTMSSLTRVQEHNVVVRYKSGNANVKTLARETGVSIQTIYTTLKRNGVAIRRHTIRLEEADRLRVVVACRDDGNNANEAAELFGISPETVFKILREHGVKLPQGRPRIHDVNHAAFDILTPACLYFLGFLFADGCVHQDAYGAPALICGLAEKDRKHLEKLRTFVGSTHAITRTEKTATSFGGPFVYWRVRSTQLCAALTSRGIIKKHVRVPIDELVRSRDFWRGCIDGDGSLGAYNGNAEIRLAGQAPLLTTFQQFLAANGFFVPKQVRTQSGIFTVACGCGPAQRLIDLLYRDSIVALDRKYERARVLMDGLNGRFDNFDFYEGAARVNVLP